MTTTSARILIIEDNPVSMELMIYLLKSYGYTTLFAFDAEAGLRLAKSASPQMILCDVNLPGMSGLAFMREVKQSEGSRTVPIIAVTAMAMAGDEEGLLTMGFDGYIGKPIDPELLQGQLEGYLNA